jgi:hypothetical protein
MRYISAGLVLLAALVPSVALAQTLPVGTYDCTLQAPGEKMQEIGVLKVTPEGFSGPQAEDAEDELFVYLLNPDNSVDLPNEFATNVEGGAEMVDALFYPDFASLKTNIRMTDGTTRRWSVPCGPNRTSHGRYPFPQQSP